MQALYVTTGGPVATFFDAVIPVEETEAVDSTHIKILKKMSVSQFIREPGSDIKSGQGVLEKDQVLRAAEIGLLATVGRIKAIAVYKKPVIGLLSTGTELVEASTEVLEDGKIRDSNKLMLKAILKEFNVASEIVDFGSISDNQEVLEAAFKKTSQGCDILVTSGGVSMGEMDLVKPFLEKNGTLLFGRINMKPGKPTTVATLDRANGGKCLVFALPGNPVSAFVTAHLFVVTAARVMAGHVDSYAWDSRQVQVVPRSVKVDPERPEYHRTICIQDSTSGKVFALSTGSQMSSRLLSAKSANSFVILPRGTKENNNSYHCTG